MSQTLTLDANVAQVINPAANRISDYDSQVGKQTRKLSEAALQVSKSSLVTAIVSTLLLRVASRVSFVLLGFYLGEHFASATIVAVVLEAFYLSELVLAPIIGSLSDHLGHKPFLLFAPLMGSIAAVCFAGVTLLFPHPHTTSFDAQLVVLLLTVLVGRLLEGVATAFNTPASLGYITEVTSHSNTLRLRVMTAFEVVTVAGLALAIPFAGKVSSLVGTRGFFLVIALHILNGVLIACFLKERKRHAVRVNAHHSLIESLSTIRYKRIFTFLPAWLSINALVGAWLTLSTIILTYPEPAASLRHPGQLLYGGFSKEFATLLLGGFGLLFLAGMGLWLLILPHLRRTTVMLIGLGGLSISIIGLTLINGLDKNGAHLSIGPQPLLFFLIPLVILGVLLSSGFTPASLTQMAAISELLPSKRGAVMGLYSVVMGAGQLIGASLGGLCVDLGGFYGLMGFSIGLGLISLGSVIYMHIHGHDLIANVSRNK
ncbi:MAG TPA: MFS transporter [Ktedonobacteraceae bacterium]|nr:MFS transporter [Ktedonobacteraceae bacterium]